MDLTISFLTQVNRPKMRSEGEGWGGRRGGERVPANRMGPPRRLSPPGRTRAVWLRPGPAYPRGRAGGRSTGPAVRCPAKDGRRTPFWACTRGVHKTGGFMGGAGGVATGMGRKCSPGQVRAGTPPGPIGLGWDGAAKVAVVARMGRDRRLSTARRKNPVMNPRGRLRGIQATILPTSEKEERKQGRGKKKKNERRKLAAGTGGFTAPSAPDKPVGPGARFLLRAGPAWKRGPVRRLHDFLRPVCSGRAPEVRTHLGEAENFTEIQPTAGPESPSGPLTGPTGRVGSNLASGRAGWRALFVRFREANLARLAESALLPAGPGKKKKRPRRLCWLAVAPGGGQTPRPEGETPTPFVVQGFLLRGRHPLATGVDCVGEAQGRTVRQ